MPSPGIGYVTLGRDKTMNRMNKLRATANAQTRRRIKIVMAVEEVNGKQICKASGISYPTFQALLNNPKVQPKISRVAKIADALDFSLDALVGPSSLFASRIGKLVKALA